MPQELFDKLTLKAVTDAVAAQAPSDLALAARAYYDGDHWQNGDGWIGARPPAGSTQAATAMALIESAFVSENVIREIIERHKAGILGREPRWSFVPVRPLEDGEAPNPSEQERIDEIEAALTEWWDDRRPHALLQDALITALLGGRASLRIFVPADLRSEDSTIQVDEGIAGALQFIYVDTPDPTTAAVLIDENSRDQVGAFLRTLYPESSFMGVTPSGAGTQVAEITYVNDDGTTALRIIDSSSVIDEANPPLALARHITQRDLIRKPMITSQVIQLQKALNLTLTQMLRNVNLAGSLERIMINVMPPGEYVDTAGKPYVQGVSTGARVFKPQNMPIGAGMSAFLHGQELKDAEGNVTGYANGSVNYHDPSPVDTFVATRDTLYGAMLGQVQQLHALISGDATASGKSRIQARAEFEASLGESSEPLGDLGRWLLETVAALAAIFAKQPDRYIDLRCEFQPIVDAGPLAADERQEIVNEFEKGVFSHETTLSRLDSDDVDAELARIEAEELASATSMLGPVATQPGTPPRAGELPPPTPTPAPTVPPIKNEAA